MSFLRFRRKFAQAVIAPQNFSGFILPRQHIVGGLVSEPPPFNELYPWDLQATDEWTLGTKTDPGAGTRSNPLSPTQAFASGPKSSGDKVIRWIGGADYEFSHNSTPFDYRFATILPTSGASATRRVIHQAEFPGSTDPATRVRIRRVGGAGSIIGFNQTNYAVWDGFMLDTKTLLTETSDDRFGEAAQMSAWFSNGCKFIRMYSDHQNANYAGSNRSNLYIQYCDDMEVGDCWLSNIGVISSVGGNVLLAELYDNTNSTIHHCEFWNGPAGIWSKGQYDKPDGVHSNRMHHNKIHDCGIGISVANPIQTTLSRAVWAYQNQIYDCQIGMEVMSFNSNEPKGIVYVNNSIYNGVSRGPGWAGVPTGMFFRHVTASSYASGCLIVSRNNAVHNMSNMIYTHDNGAQYDFMTWDFNAYNTITGGGGFWRQGEGGPQQTIATWRAESPARDNTVVTAAFNWQDIANENITPLAGSPLINAGQDYLQLLGGSNTAPCNIGAYMSAGDVFGPRVVTP